MQELNPFLMTGAGIILPLAQEYLNKYIQEKFRMLVIFGVSLIIGITYGVYEYGTLNAVFSNSIMIFGVSQAMFNLVVRGGRDNKK